MADEYEEITESIEVDTEAFTDFLASTFPDGPGTYMVTILPPDEETETFEIHTVRILDPEGRSTGPGVTVHRAPPPDKASLN